MCSTRTTAERNQRLAAAEHSARRGSYPETAMKPLALDDRIITFALDSTREERERNEHNPPHAVR